MSDPTHILEALRALSRRERLFVAARVGLALLAGLLLLWLGAMGAAAAGLSRWVTRFALLIPLLGGVGLAAALLLRRWRLAGDVVHQAQAVEAVRPQLRGLITPLAEHPLGPEPGQSASIFGLLVENVQQGLRQVSVRAVHPPRLGLPSGGLALALLAFVVGAVLSPLSPAQTLAWLAGGRVQWLAEQDLDALQDAQKVRVGDLSLRYEYPAYTRLPPLEVPNASGEIHGPPGTRVRISARTDERYDSVLVQSYDLPPQEAVLTDRSFQGELVILEDGSWRAVFQRGAEVQSTREFAIVSESDDAPVVELLAEGRGIEVELDDPIVLEWSARDDFGISQVYLEGNKRQLELLAAPVGEPAELKDRVETTAKDLGLRPGSETALRVVAVDNDGVALQKAGYSRVFVVRVKGEGQQEQRQQVAYRKELRDALVQVLGPYKRDPRTLASDRAELGDWAREASERFGPLNTLVATRWEGDDLRTLEGRIIEEVQYEGQELLRFAMELSVGEGPLDPQDLESVHARHEGLMAVMETYVLMLDRIVRYQGMGLLKEQVQQMERTAFQAATAAELADAEGLTASREALSAQVTELQGLALEVDNGTVAGMVHQTTGDLEQLLEAAERAQSAGDLERAGELMEWAQQELERLRRNLESWQQALQEMNEGESEALRKLIEELERIEAEERALLSETQGLRAAQGVDDADWSATWDELAKLAASARRRAEQAKAQTKNASGHEQRSLDAAIQAAIRLEEAIAARDVRGAQVASAAARRQLQDAGMSMRFYQRPQSRVSSLETASEEAWEVRLRLDALDRRTQQGNPGLAKALGQKVATQDGLREDTEKTQPVAAELAGKLPGGAPGLEENLDAAVREMAKAEDALVEGLPLAAEGAEEAAADRIRLALEALQQPAAASAQMGAEMGASSEGQGGDPDGSGSGEAFGGEPNPIMELPEPERDVDIARYRRELMQGMEGDVPDEYEALKRRYYEELVRQ